MSNQSTASPDVLDSPQQTGLAVPAPSKTSVPVRMGVAPQSIEEAWRLAQLVAQSELVPKDFQGKPHNVLIAMELGLEVGIPWLQSVQGTSVINGRPGFFGDLFLAVIVASPVYRQHDEYYEVAVERDVEVPGGRTEKRWIFERRDGLVAEDWKRDDTVAVCSFWRRGKDEPTTRRFNVGQARKAQLLGKQGPWTTYPDRMLAMRARAWAGRDTFPDVLKGVKSAEELMDIPDDRPQQAEPIQPRRASEARAVSPEPPAVGTSPAAQPASPPAAAATPSPAPTAGATQELRGLLVTNTSFVKPKVGEPYFEIQTTDARTGEVRPFVTRDEQLYKEAASFEGSEHRLVAGFHTAPKAGATDVAYVLDGIALDEGAQPGELFR